MFIVFDAPRMHTFSMSQGPEDDLLPWVVGGVLLIAMTIAVSAVAGSGRNPVVPATVHGSEQLAKDPLPEPRGVAAPAQSQRTK